MKVVKSRPNKRKIDWFEVFLSCLTPSIALVVILYLIYSFYADDIEAFFKNAFLQHEIAQETTLNNEPSSDLHWVIAEDLLTDETIEPNEPEVTEPVEDAPEVPPIKELSSELLDSGYEFKNIDFAALQEINPDICGWLVIDGTNIDFPIVQGDDNDYYLHHTFDGDENKTGTLFLDARNNSLKKPEEELSDTSIIYGHYLKSGSMFTELSKFKKQLFYEAHPWGILYTPNACYKINFYATRIIDGKDDSTIYREDYEDDNYDDELRFNSYTAGVIADSLIRTGIRPDYDDKQMIFITCSYEKSYKDLYDTDTLRCAVYGILEQQLTNIYENKEPENEQVKALKY